MSTVGSAFLVEDNDDVRQWLVACVEEAFDKPSLAVARDLREGRRIVERDWKRAQAHGQPNLFDIALIDIGLPDGNGIELIGMIRERDPGCICIVTTIYDDDAHLFEAIQAGAEGYLLKFHETERMVELLRRIRDGEPPLSPAIARRMLAALRGRAPLPSVASGAELTPRETEVLGLLGRGFQLSQVADSLDISQNTASSHVKSIYRKLHISNRAEAARAAIERGLVDRR
jgi:two-component system, NarL family, nitrate/nitrite response regulator NarL